MGETVTSVVDLNPEQLFFI